MSIVKYMRKFYRLKKETGDKNPFSAFVFLYHWKRWHIGIQCYFDEKIYDSKTRKTYLSRIDKYTRCWSFVREEFQPKRTRWWYFLHYCDYRLEKLRCKGLDARNYFTYEFYNFRHSKRKTFVTEGRLGELVKAYNGNGDMSLLRNKVKFNQCFSKYISRKWWSSADSSQDDFQKFCSSLKEVIVKPLNGGQGRGIYLARIETEEQREQLYYDVKDKNVIIEEIIKQHASLSELNPSSVNTLRIYSVLKNEEVYITCAFLRIGGGDSVVDNYHAGGYAAMIDTETGVIISKPINRKGERIVRHPVTKKVIVGFEYPCWERVIETVKEAHRMIPDLRYVAWDVVVTDAEEITFVEGNEYGGVDAQQQLTLMGMLPIYENLL